MANTLRPPSHCLGTVKTASSKLFAPVRHLAAITIPPAAAFGKAFGNSFGTICLLLLFTQGITAPAAITAAMLTWPILTVAGIAFFGVAFISLFMEGRKTWQYYQGKDKKSEETITKPPNRCLLALRNALLPVFGAIPLAGALAKGATMAFGTYITVGILFGVTGGGAGIAILVNALICGLAVALVSLGKEGRDTYKHLKVPVSRWCGIQSKEPDENEELRTKRDSDLIRLLRYGTKKTGLYYAGRWTKDSPRANEAISWIPSTLAAVGKGFGNAFGMVKIVAFLSGIIAHNPLALTSPWNIPIILAVGLSEFIISMAFEGNHFRRHCQHSFNQVLDVDIPAKKASAIGTTLEKYFYPLPRSLRTVLGFLVSGIAAVAKGATMGFGMITTLGILTHIGVLGLPVIAFSNPVGGIILGLVIFAAIAVGIVSWAKEGREVREWASAEKPADLQQSLAKAPDGYQPLIENEPELDLVADAEHNRFISGLALEVYSPTPARKNVSSGSSRLGHQRQNLRPGPATETAAQVEGYNPQARHSNYYVPKRVMPKGQRMVAVTPGQLKTALANLKSSSNSHLVTPGGITEGFAPMPTSKLLRTASSPALHLSPPACTISANTTRV